MVKITVQAGIDNGFPAVIGMVIEFGAGDAKAAAHEAALFARRLAEQSRTQLRALTANLELAQ